MTNPFTEGQSVLFPPKTKFPPEPGRPARVMLRADGVALRAHSARMLTHS